MTGTDGHEEIDTLGFGDRGYIAVITFGLILSACGSTVGPEETELRFDGDGELDVPDTIALLPQATFLFAPPPRSRFVEATASGGAVAVTRVSADGVVLRSRDTGSATLALRLERDVERWDEQGEGTVVLATEEHGGSTEILVRAPTAIDFFGPPPPWFVQRGQEVTVRYALRAGERELLGTGASVWMASGLELNDDVVDGVREARLTAGGVGDFEIVSSIPGHEQIDVRVGEPDAVDGIELDIFARDPKVDGGALVNAYALAETHRVLSYTGMVLEAGPAEVCRADEADGMPWSVRFVGAGDCVVRASTARGISAEQVVQVDR